VRVTWKDSRSWLDGSEILTTENTENSEESSEGYAELESLIRRAWTTTGEVGMPGVEPGSRAYKARALTIELHPSGCSRAERCCAGSKSSAAYAEARQRSGGYQQSGGIGYGVLGVSSLNPAPCPPNPDYRKLLHMYTVLIKGLEFYGHHGVPAEEQVIGHRYRVDIEFEIEGDTDETDDIGNTVDYGMVATQITAIAEGQRYKTVERLARVIGERLLKEHACVKRLTITLVKRLPPAPMMADEAGVRLILDR
jgi:7,8-dihydroneopterin aldolase/epimerase/oxygenase